MLFVDIIKKKRGQGGRENMRNGTEEIYKDYELICKSKVKAVTGSLKLKLENISQKEGAAGMTQLTIDGINY